MVKIIISVEVNLENQPLTSEQYFTPLANTFKSLLFEEIVPTILILAKVGASVRVVRWSKILLNFYKLRRYLNNLRDSIRTKKIKATCRAKIQDSSRYQVDLEELNAAYGQVMEEAHGQFVATIMASSGLEEAVIESFSMAAQKINVYQLLMTNYEVASVEREAFTILEKTIDALNRMIRAHMIIAFATNTIYLLFIIWI